MHRGCSRFTLAIMLALCFFLTLPVSTNGAAYYVQSYEELYTALENAQDGDIIFINGEIKVLQTLSVQADVTISADFPAVLIKCTQTIFKVNNGSALTLAGPLTLQGNTDNDTLILCQGGSSLTLNSGVVLRDNITSGAALGGAVTLYDSQFIMNGGSILHCGCTLTHTPSGEHGGGAMGGAVRLRTSALASQPARFIMKGGSIDGCFAMNGGAVGAENLGSPFGVRVEICGGSIQNCHAAAAEDFYSTSQYGLGSAIFLYNDLSRGNGTVTDALCIMQGGTISNCRSHSRGVLAYYHNQRRYGGQFRLFGGSIYNNSTSGTTLSAAEGSCIYLGEKVITGEPCLILGSNMQLQDDIYLSGSGLFAVQQDFMGSARVLATGLHASAQIAGSVDRNGNPADALEQVADRLVILSENVALHGSLQTIAQGSGYYLGMSDTQVPSDPPETFPTEPSIPTPTEPIPTETTQPTFCPTDPCTSTMPIPTQPSYTSATHPTTPPTIDTVTPPPTLSTQPQPSETIPEAITPSAAATYPPESVPSVTIPASSSPSTDVITVPSTEATAPPPAHSNPQQSQDKTAPTQPDRLPATIETEPLPWVLLLVIGLMFILVTFLLKLHS